MTILFTLILAFVALGICLYHRRSQRVTLAVVGIIFAAATLLTGTTPVLFVLYLIGCGLIAIPAVRRRLFSQPTLQVFRKILPAMSQTEKEAIDAGTVWWEAELFKGKPDWSKLTDIQAPQLSAEEQAFIDGPVNEVCRMTNDYEVTHELADLPPEVWQYLKDHKFFAMIIKKKYGGLEFSAYAQSIVLQKLTGVSGVLSSTVGVPNSLGPGELLQHYGTTEQQDHYLPRLAEGKEIPCFALTSPEAGSDAGAIPDYGIVCKGQWQGQEVLGMNLTWNKRYITLAPVATVLGLAFKLQDPDGLLGLKDEAGETKKDIGITCALIPTDMEGVKIGRRHFPLNVPFQNGPTQGDNIFVPLDFIIGGPDMAGQGWRMLVECLSVGRGITLPSNSTGGTKSAALATGAYARIRRQFKQPIGHMEGIEEPLARLAGNAYMMDAASQLTVAGIDLGEKPSVISAIVKYHCTHRGQRCLIDAMDIAGGKGVCLGPANFLARGYQGSPIAVTVEGANILTRSMIIYGQGAIRCHPYVLAEMDAAHSTERNALARFDSALFGHIGFSMSNAVRSLWLGITDGRGSDSPVPNDPNFNGVVHDQIKGYYQKLNRYSANMALLSDVSMAVLGGSLKRKERLSARLGDVLSQLYLSSATLKRFEMEGYQESDLPLVHWSVQDSLRQAEEAITELLRNFPSRSAATLLRVLILPLGTVRRAPSDALDNQVAQILQTPSATRSRIGRNQYLEPSEHNPVGKIEFALETILKAEPIFDAICKKAEKRRPFTQLDKVAQLGLDNGWISEQEAQVLRDAETVRLETINVDDFDPSELIVKKPSKPLSQVA
ncbi:acyl-CoA dehydrogenase FadE [Vibrio algicola]|uniref:Acyl-coenzyme A dehydrogenase n=1 Tax=Vibrio algicola TaxID=2662262 RepID=A0A5Q0TGR4_9VIBR|nr:acyl-CoA dehydrogenase FadE [Vibrio algicola]